jgi:hypothetical protein
MPSGVSRCHWRWCATRYCRVPMGVLLTTPLASSSCRLRVPNPPGSHLLSVCPVSLRSSTYCRPSSLLPSPVEVAMPLHIVSACSLVRLAKVSVEVYWGNSMQLLSLRMLSQCLCIAWIKAICQVGRGGLLNSNCCWTTCLWTTLQNYELPPAPVYSLPAYIFALLLTSRGILIAPPAPESPG